MITGSFNCSPSASHQNDEVLLVINPPQLAADFTREMDRLSQGAVLRIRERLQPKLTQAQQWDGEAVKEGKTDR